MLKKTISIVLAGALMSGTFVGTSAVQATQTDSINITALTASYEVVKTGNFEGRSDHITTGDVSILKTSDGYVAVLNSNFSLDGAPAPTLGFGNNGFDKKTEFTKLKSKSGLQMYKIPTNIDVENFNEFYVWCSDFSVPLGVASLK